MRDYSKISPAFWTGKTGRELRWLGVDCQMLALYLITCHHATMLGLYYLPVAYVAADTGLTLEGALKGLASLSEAGFCKYDAPSEWVFVVEMARFQVLNNNEPLVPTDKRVLGIAKEYANMPNNPFLCDFFEKYRGAFHLNIARGVGERDAPSMPLRSQEQEQEQKPGAEIKSTTSPSKLSVVDIRFLFHESFGIQMPPGCAGLATELCGGHSAAAIRDAFKIAANQGIKTMAYVRGVLVGEKLPPKESGNGTRRTAGGTGQVGRKAGFSEANGPGTDWTA